MSPSFASTSDTAWRLLLDPPASGAWNMAVDEVLLDGVANGSAPPTVRFYEWAPACLSLGYFQAFEVVDVDGCRRLGVDVVRRPTGGRAILHDRELTYSVALPLRLLGDDGGVLPSYHRLSLALERGLTRLGAPVVLAPETAAQTAPDHGPVCFDRPSAHEILLDGRKLVGSAQVRRATAMLQHGSILIEPRIERLLACLRLPDGPAGRIEDGVTGLDAVGDFEPAAIAMALADAFAEEFAANLVPGRLRPDERVAAEAISVSKYQSVAWTERPPAILAGNTTRTR
ncbi:MAG TPA: lipoate--protein ligase family protein [Candidatus Acidoferrum sp.]|nr:lipoate--protein ligase family protein [Candidatus Acidoferrum sp.]